MTQANEPNDFPREVDRQFRHLNRRVERLEDTQISPQEYARSFDRIYDDTSAIRREIGELDRKVDRLENEVTQMRAEMNGKIDTILRHITGQGNQ
jgi:predicted RNase H-like nuclease (RuvC/YqgF family)